MTDKHDFKAALEALPEKGKVFMYEEDANLYIDDHQETIQTALRIADRLASGVVSIEISELGEARHSKITYSGITGDKRGGE